jgi:hypothetical protein
MEAGDPVNMVKSPAATASLMNPARANNGPDGGLHPPYARWLAQPAMC